MKLILIILILSIQAHAQKGSIVPKYDTINYQVSKSTNYQYLPLYSFDTTKEGIIMKKVAEYKNGSWIIFDSARTETIIRTEYQKLRK